MFENLEPRQLLAMTTLSPDADTLDANGSGGTEPQPELLRQMEDLNRGVVAVRSSGSTAYVGWRLLGTDPSDIAFNLYRSSGGRGGSEVKLNASPITSSTNFVDSTINFSSANIYHVRPVIDGIEQDPSESFTLVANAPTQQYINVPLDIPPNATIQLPRGVAGDPGSHDYFYVANDTSVGDLDGDGDYEIIVKWDPFNPDDIDDPDNNPPRTGEGSSQDNSRAGFTGNVIIDAYDFDGQGNSTLLWRIDLGRNIRAGAHYTQMLVYDLDGDGRAEVTLKTAEATTDAAGTVIGDPAADYRNSSGYVLSGPEYLTVFDGFHGTIIDSVEFEPERGSVSSWGDSYGNRVDRFQATIAYLDGVHPSLVWGRGYAGPQGGFNARNEVAAYDFVDGELVVRWVFEAATNGQNPGYVGQSAHSITVGDVDGDGRDEIITGASALDDDGTLLYNTGLGHGDALHMSDMDPSRPGLEVFMPHESRSAYESQGRDAGGELRNAATGELLMQIPSNDDVGRGVAADIDPNHPGYEFWATTNQGTRMVYNVQDGPIYETPGNMFYNFVVWWDADLTRELLDGTTISEWNNPGRSNFDLNPGQGGTQQYAPNASSNNGSKSTPALSADILGDWREEVIWRRSDNAALEIFTTIIPSTDRFYTLMHDSQYRAAIAWQNSGYNQPPHPSFFFGADMDAPPTPKIYLAGGLDGDYNDDGVVNSADYIVWRNSLESQTNMAADGNHNSIIDQGDFDVWRQNYGNTAPEAPAVGSGTKLLASAANTSAIPDIIIETPVETPVEASVNDVVVPPVSLTPDVSFRLNLARFSARPTPISAELADTLLVAELVAPRVAGVETVANRRALNAADESVDDENLFRALDSVFAQLDSFV